MKINVSKLTGPALNWAVEEAQGYGDTYLRFWRQGGDKRFTHCLVMRNYAEHWSESGQIIEREKICLIIGHSGVWLAYSLQNYIDEPKFMKDGPTALIAAMRSFVESKLGDFVEVPDDLME
jgi:hypothetical protein